MLILLFKFLKERESFKEQEKKKKESHVNPVINFTSHLQNEYANEAEQIK